MTSYLKKRMKLFIPIIFCSLLVACGGGNGDTGDDTDNPELIWDQGNWDQNNWQ